MAAVPSIGRASLVEAPRVAPQAAATEGLYERHAAKIQSYCHHQLGSREEAEDAVQTTFMNAFRALGRGVVPEAESAWLFKIAENVCLSRRRSSWRRGKIESPSDFECDRGDRPGPEPPARRADRDRGRARIDARAAAPRDSAARMAGPLLSRGRGGARRLPVRSRDTHLPCPPLARPGAGAAGLDQACEAQELPPRVARARPRHRCGRVEDAARRRAPRSRRPRQRWPSRPQPEPQSPWRRSRRRSRRSARPPRLSSHLHPTPPRARRSRSRRPRTGRPDPQRSRRQHARRDPPRRSPLARLSPARFPSARPLRLPFTTLRSQPIR